MNVSPRVCVRHDLIEKPIVRCIGMGFTACMPFAVNNAGNMPVCVIHWETGWGGAGRNGV